MAMKSDLQRAYEILDAKRVRYDLLWRYYDGDHPLVYSTERLHEVFRLLDAKFVENWCAVVVDSVLERLQLERLMVADDEGLSELLGGLWTATELDLDADDAHLGALVTGESFVVVWPDADGNVEAFYNDPRMCHVEYGTDNPREVAWAAKWWVDQAEKRRLTLYYADRLEYYVSRKAAKQVTSWKAMEATEEKSAENPYGVVPVFHFQRERRKAISELGNVIPLQAAVNKLLADMMVSAEFGAFKQRFIISNADVGTLKNAPNEIWDIPAGDGVGQNTAVGELSSTDLDNYSGAIDNLVAAISAISRTPRHYFFSSGGAPSGEALIALEAPLNKKAARYVRRFGRTWQRVGAFMLKVAGVDVPADKVGAVYAEAATVQPRTQAEVRQVSVGAGMPLTTVLRDEGWSEAELAQLEADRIAEGAAAQESLAQALLEQQRRFDQGENL